MPLPPAVQVVDRTHVLCRGRRLLYFGGCDYHRLARHPAVLKALREGLAKYGLSVSASRTTTGNHPLYERLEHQLAAFFGTESALLAPNGAAPALMVAQALAGRFTHALLDERAHGCLVDAAHFLDCPVLKFQHCDPADVARILQRLGMVKPILLTDGMFAHSGEAAPLKEYLALLPPRAIVLLDDAHGAAVLGKTGRGTVEHAGVRSRQIIRTIALSKAFGVFGGAVLGSHGLRNEIIERSRAFIGSTPLPLPLANAALASLALLRRGSRMLSGLRDNATRLRDHLRCGGLAIPDAPGPIISLKPRDAREARRLSRSLLAAGIHPPLIKYPGGPPDGHFRFAISSAHSRDQLVRVAEAILSALAATK